MVAQGVAAPEIRDAVLQGLAQVPVVHAPHHDAARRQPRIVAAQANDKALRLLLVHGELAIHAGAVLVLHAHAVLEHEAQAIHRHRAPGGIHIVIRRPENHVHRTVIAPAALAIFDKQVLASRERDLHDFSPLARTRGRDIHRHGLTRNRANFLYLRPAHVGAFPRGRHRGHESVARVVTRKVHHVIIAEAAYSLHHVIGVREPDLACKLVYQDSVHAPVEAILRGGFAQHHHRTERIDLPARNADAHRRGIADARKPDYGFCGLALRRISQQVLPVVAGNVDVHEVARSVRTLRAHAPAIHQTARARVYNHVGTLHVRVLRNRNAERPRLRRIGGGSGNGVINEREVVATAGLVVLGGLLALLLTRAVVVDNRLGQRIDGRTRGGVREHAGLHHQVPAAHRIEVVVREFKMLEPVRCRTPAARRVEAVGVLFLLVGIENARARRKRVIVLLFLELDTQRKHFKSIYGERVRRKSEYTQKQCK